MAAARRRVAAQHEDWLNLADAEAPWFSPPALKRALPDGLEPTPPEVRAEHRVRWYGDDASDSARLADDRSDYIDWLLRDVLGWGDDYLVGADLPSEFSEGITQHEVTVKPTGVYLPAPPAPVGLLEESPHVDDASRSEPPVPRVLVFSLPAGSAPLSQPAGDTWTSTHVQRAALACRRHGVPLALVTDGDYLTLVHAPQRGATGWGTWRASEFAAEPVLLDSFRTMLRSRRFIGAAQHNTPEALLAESADSQAEVTDQLGVQVRRATELLVNAISRADRDRGGTLLTGIAPDKVYEAAVTVMMRIVFLLIAEEKDRLLPIDDTLYQDLYSIRTLRETLEKERFENPESLETRTTAWHRLLATSRALHAGVHHDELSLPAYGGSLFDPDRFPFLEGRARDSTWQTAGGTPIAVTDLDMLAILDSLLVLRFSDSRGATDTRRLSYRNVDVEQIGHIYERLLDHGAVIAEHVVLGLRGKPGEEPEIALPDLEAERMNGTAALVSWLSSPRAVKAGRRVGTKKQVEKLLDAPVDRNRRAGLVQACQGDQTTAARIEPFVNLLRLNLRDRPLVFLQGSMYVTETGSRRNSGTAYTTKALAEEIVKHALDPLCYSPGPQDTPDTNRWRIRGSAEILDLKVCDPAVGSGAILVAACRYLAERLIKAWQAEGDRRSTDTATAADDPNRLDVVIEARRLIAERCCYGVDRNPMAVELAKLSMWLTTVARNRPFTFLDHAIKTGDSLLGITDLDQLRTLHYDPGVGRARPAPIPGFQTGGDAVTAIERLVQEALESRIEMHDIETISPADIERKQDLHRRSQEHLLILEAIADVLTGVTLNTAGEKDPVTMLTRRLEADAPTIVELIAALHTPQQEATLRQVRKRARGKLNIGCPDGAPARHPLHWPIAFPEVFNNPGTGSFDAIVGNPPFMGGQKITGTTGTDYRNHLIAWIANGKKGSADLVAYFFLTAAKIAKSFGLLATNTIAQGNTSKVGLTQIIDSGWTVHRAISSTAWPGDATLEVAKVWAISSKWHGRHVLDERTVGGVDEMLYPKSRSGWRKQRLIVNANKSFQGSIVLGMGFIMNPEEAQALIDKDPRNTDVLFPYLGGEDLNQSPTQTAPRWIINFFDWSEHRARQYPDCFAIVEENVKPMRRERKPNGEFKQRKPRAERYWIYAERSSKLYRMIEPLERIIAISQVSKIVQPVLVSTGQVLSMTAVVFAYDDDFHFGVLTSGFHYRWAIRHASTLESRIRYTPSDVFETFPQPPYSASVEYAGKVLNEHRSHLMATRRLGLTSLYNLVHDPETRFDKEMQMLRDLHIKLDLAVCDAYDFKLELEHGFYEVRGQGIRFTFAPDAADEVLDLLLELNKERYESERRSGVHKSKKNPKKMKAITDSSQRSFLGHQF